MNAYEQANKDYKADKMSMEYLNYTNKQLTDELEVQKNKLSKCEEGSQEYALACKNISAINWSLTNRKFEASFPEYQTKEEFFKSIEDINKQIAEEMKDKLTDEIAKNTTIKDLNRKKNALNRALTVRTNAERLAMPNDVEIIAEVKKDEPQKAPRVTAWKRQ